MARLLEEKVAIVTGAGVGLGRAIAVALAREGASVAVTYSKSEEEAARTSDLVREAGGEALLLQADVTQDCQVRTMVSRTLERFGRVDLLVNNAGITVHVPFSDLEGLSEEAWDRVLAVNLKGPFLCSRAVAEPMQRQGGGRIVNIASISGMRAEGSSLAYCSSKAAVIQLTKCLAKALGPQIQVNAVSPGAVGETRWNEGIANLAAKQERQSQGSVLKRVATPGEIADVVLFLATRGDFMTGEIVVVDGGATLM